MDALYPRLLVADFPACFRFYDAVLPELSGAVRQKGEAAGPYATWDLGDQAVLSLLARAGLAEVLGEVRAPASDATMLTLRVADVDAALAHCLAHGGTAVAPATDRPHWGPNLRTAHLRDPEGRLIELQSY
ncbi:VOC family protein [Kitasatospora sp. NPDC006697]|uniref:VOC family protein n=1 Tax=Kitasatospora sp. NPDC006697 TaxID=3364020 RepID=UPI0036AAEADA